VYDIYIYMYVCVCVCAFCASVSQQFRRGRGLVTVAIGGSKKARSCVAALVARLGTQHFSFMFFPYDDTDWTDEAWYGDVTLVRSPVPQFKWWYVVLFAGAAGSSVEEEEKREGRGKDRTHLVCILYSDMGWSG